VSTAAVRTFTAPDGTRLAYREAGAGTPVVCLPGGPMQDPRYLADLGGLTQRARLLLLDLRGTGSSSTPTDSTSYRCERMVDDVEALRTDLQVERTSVLGHSAGAQLAVRYALRYPERVHRLVLITPGLASLGIEVSNSDRRRVTDLRRGESWFAAASTALDDLAAGRITADTETAIAPLFYGTWNATTRVHQAAAESQTNHVAAEVFADAARSEAGNLRAALPPPGDADAGTRRRARRQHPTEGRRDPRRAHSGRRAPHPARGSALPLARQPRTVHRPRRPVPAPPHDSTDATMTAPTTELPVPKRVPGRTWVRYQPRHGTAYGTAHAEPTTLVLLTIVSVRRWDGARSAGRRVSRLLVSWVGWAWTTSAVTR